MQEHIQPSGKVDLLDLVNNIKNTPNKAVFEKKLKIEVTADDFIPEVRGDYDKLSEVVQNLLITQLSIQINLQVFR